MQITINKREKEFDEFVEDIKFFLDKEDKLQQHLDSHFLPYKENFEPANAWTIVKNFPWHSKDNHHLWHDGRVIQLRTYLDHGQFSCIPGPLPNYYLDTLVKNHLKFVTELQEFFKDKYALYYLEPELSIDTRFICAYSYFIAQEVN